MFPSTDCTVIAEAVVRPFWRSCRVEYSFVSKKFECGSRVRSISRIEEETRRSLLTSSTYWSSIAPRIAV